MPYRYENVQITKDNNDKNQLYETNVYPDVQVSENDNYVITALGDRLDLLALDFYGDMSYWWVIAIANELPGDSLYPPVGVQLRIPSSAIAANNSYKRENTTR